ncbi:MAG TPA: hypothetical protein VMA34_08905 [Terracidiphilus sp.]|nr:hypothetical protein [Terracidiphilus sp.]
MDRRGRKRERHGPKARRGTVLIVLFVALVVVLLFLRLIAFVHGRPRL